MIALKPFVDSRHHRLRKGREVAATTVVACLLMFAGCGGSEDDAAAEAEAAAKRKVSFSVVNHTGADMREVGITGTVKPMGFGTIDRGDTETLSHSEFTVPDKIMIGWTAPGGERIAKSVSLERIGRDYRGDVRLTVVASGAVTAARGD